MDESPLARSEGCDYCFQQSDYWSTNEWRYVTLIGATSEHLEVGVCPQCGTHYMYGAATWGRPSFVRPDDLAGLLKEVHDYESSKRNG